jgi:hypothetical protein
VLCWTTPSTRICCRHSAAVKAPACPKRCGEQREASSASQMPPKRMKNRELYHTAVGGGEVEGVGGDDDVTSSTGALVDPGVTRRDT